MQSSRKIASEGTEFLGRYANEVARLADGLAQLQQSLSKIYESALADGGAEDLQRLDAFTQTAEALASIADRLAREPMLDHGAVAKMVSTIKLADVAARLVGDTHVDPLLGSGDCEVF